VAAGDIGPLADCLSEDWRSYLAERLAAWRMNRTRPVLLDFAFRDATVVGLQDWRRRIATGRPCVSMCRPPSTSAICRAANWSRACHLRPEQQLWTLARGEQDWLIAGIEVVGTAAAYRDCVVFRESA
jgi:hypothetical protein